MRLRIDVELDYRFSRATPVLLALEVARGDDQRLVTDCLTVDGSSPLRPMPGECGIGQRTWAFPTERLVARYTGTVEVTRAVPDLARLDAAPVDAVPHDAVQFLWPSRYCQSDRLCGFVERTFGGLAGGAKVAAMAKWIETEIAYVSGSSTAATTVIDSFVARRGICRDFAHLLVSFARAADIPARMVAGYGLGVDPPDFHAVAEVWLAEGGHGAWTMVDATGMTTPDRVARIAVGRDATDVSFMTSFGTATFAAQKVHVEAAA